VTIIALSTSYLIGGAEAHGGWKELSTLKAAKFSLHIRMTAAVASVSYTVEPHRILQFFTFLEMQPDEESCVGKWALAADIIYIILLIF
jgi:hypothetical protein